jgi:type II secretory pathway pseudopilin PulG
MTQPMQRPPGESSSRSDGPLVLILGLGAIAFIVVIVLAAQRNDDLTQVVTAAEATSDQIATGQTALVAVGCYDGEIDGQYGGQTDQAIRDFQAAASLTVDGIFGPATLDALQSAVNAGTTVCTTTGGGDSGGSTDASATDDGGGTDGSATDDGGGADTRVATLSSPSYGPTIFTVKSWDCTGGAGDLTLTGNADPGLTLVIAMAGGSGTLVVDGGDEQDGITLNGAMSTLSKVVGSFSATGTFVEPNLIGESFDVVGTC